MGEESVASPWRLFTYMTGRVKKRIFYLISCLFLGVSIIAFLYAYSKDANGKRNGFIRYFPPHAVTGFKSLYIGNNIYYIAGLTAQDIYLGSYTNTSYLLMIGRDLRDTQMLEIKVPENFKIAWKGLRAIVQDSQFYLIEGITPMILKSHSSAFRFPDMVKFDSIHFDACIPISSTSYIIRFYDHTRKQNMLSKITSITPYSTPEIPVLEKQIDGRFCTDGEIHYSADMNRLVYVYYYRNQIITMDTNLAVIYKARTIDTISHAKLKIDTVHSRRVVTFSAPPLLVNRKCSVSKDRLYIQSNLLANNEQKEYFNRNTVIDTYSLKDGHYLFSFYIPDYKDQKVKSFCVQGNTIYAIYKNYFVSLNIEL